MPERSLDVADPPRVDVVVAEVLGNFAYEEDVLEALSDPRRFLRPGGTLIPASVSQWVAPITADRFERDLCPWRNVGFGLDTDKYVVNSGFLHGLWGFDFSDRGRPR